MYCNRSLKQNEEIEDGETKKLCPEYTEKIRTVKVSVKVPLHVAEGVYVMVARSSGAKAKRVQKKICIRVS